MTLGGAVHPLDPFLNIELPFEAVMAVNDSWDGYGGFSFSHIHVDKVPVKPKAC